MVGEVPAPLAQTVTPLALQESRRVFVLNGLGSKKTIDIIWIKHEATPQDDLVLAKLGLSKLKIQWLPLNFC